MHPKPRSGSTYSTSVAFLRSEGETETAAVERLIREAAFTHVNRLVALRVAEGLGILPEAIGNGLASQGFRDFAEIAPGERGMRTGSASVYSYGSALTSCRSTCRHCSTPGTPLLELEPSTAAFSELIELFVASDETIWSAPDALGWSYQFFNSAEERKEMRESSAPAQLAGAGSSEPVLHALVRRRVSRAKRARCTPRRLVSGARR